MALSDNILAYWKLDESSGNASDSVNSYTLTNNGTTTYSAGKINNAADFGVANSGKYFSNATNVGLSTNAYTFNIWVNQASEPADGVTREFLNHAGIGGTDNEGIRYNNTSGTYSVKFHRVKNGVTDETLSVVDTLGTDWVMLTHTWDGTTMRGYKNGSEIGNKGSTGNGSSGVTDGFNVSTSGTPGGGFMADEIGVWSRALSPTEITALYNSASGLQYPFSVDNSTNFFAIL